MGLGVEGGEAAEGERGEGKSAGKKGGGKKRDREQTLTPQSQLLAAVVKGSLSKNCEYGSVSRSLLFEKDTELNQVSSFT